MTAMNLASVRMMSQNGVRGVQQDTGSGFVNRPVLASPAGGRTATLETLWDYFLNNVPDPDWAMRQDPNFNMTCRMCPPVNAAMTIRELTVAQLPMRVQPSQLKGVDKNEAQMVADYVKDVISALPRRIDLTRLMQNTVLMGGQGVEFVWEKSDGALKPTRWFPVHKTRFLFDRLGNLSLLTRAEPVWGGYVAEQPNSGALDAKASPWVPPSGKFVYHRYKTGQGTWANPDQEGYSYYGQGEDINLYYPVTWDRFAMFFRMRWMERYGTPFGKMWYPSNQQYGAIAAQALKDLQNGAVVSFPKPPGEPKDSLFDLEYVQVPTAGYDVFQNFYDQYTVPSVSMILLGGAEALKMGDSGSYGASVDQKQTGLTRILSYDAANIDETINTQLVPAICRQKWPNIPKEYLPKHIITPEDEKDREQLMRILSEVAKLVPVREQDVYDTAGIDRPRDDEPTVFNGQATVGMDEAGFNEAPAIVDAETMGKSKPKGGDKQPKASLADKQDKKTGGTAKETKA